MSLLDVKQHIQGDITDITLIKHPKAGMVVIHHDGCHIVKSFHFFGWFCTKKHCTTQKRYLVATSNRRLKRPALNHFHVRSSEDNPNKYPKTCCTIPPTHETNFMVYILQYVFVESRILFENLIKQSFGVSSWCK